MSHKYLSYCAIITLALIACDKDSNSPEKNCTQLAIYDLDYHFVTDAKIFDIRPDNPLEIKNGTLEYDLFEQYVSLTNNGANPWPYNHYFIYTSFFNETDGALV